jgi:hypothetical protein
MRRSLFLLVPLALVVACGDQIPTSPNEATTTSLSVVFEGRLEVGGSAFYSFTVQESGSLTATLSSVSLVGRYEALNLPLRIGVGVPRGESCTITQTAEVYPSLTRQFSAVLEPGIRCIAVTDTGLLPGAAIFSIRFVHS